MTDIAPGTPPATYMKMLITVAVAAALYMAYYFGFLHLPFWGTPTFRIDYFATTISRANSNLMQLLTHARPISELYVHYQAEMAKNLLNGQTKYIIYPLQHVVVFFYFFAVVKIVGNIYRIRLQATWVLLAWLAYMTTPGVMSDVYKLETIVGTLSKLFGVLTLWQITAWQQRRTTYRGGLIVGCFVLSIFSKEDYILPPLILLGWHLWKSGGLIEQIKRHRWLLVSLAAVLVFFVVFNEKIIPNRSYMDRVDQANSPYFMTLSPVVLLSVAWKYTFAMGYQIAALSIAFLIAMVACLARRKWRAEAILILLIVGGLMCPYLIMPNHVFSYYALNWWAWEIVALFAAIQVLTKAPRTVSLMMAAVALLPGLHDLYLHKSPTWYGAGYYRTRFTQASNLYETLERNRDRLNRFPVVAVTGIGPGGIDQSPWQNHGETAFYLSDDLGLTPKWLVFVKLPSGSYSLSPDEADGAPLSTVAIRREADLGSYPSLPLLAFDQTGHGKLTLPSN